VLLGVRERPVDQQAAAVADAHGGSRLDAVQRVPTDEHSRAVQRPGVLDPVRDHAVVQPLGSAGVRVVPGIGRVREQQQVVHRSLRVAGRSSTVGARAGPCIYDVRADGFRTLPYAGLSTDFGSPVLIGTVGASSW
jgi:hypothetical protein